MSRNSYLTSYSVGDKLYSGYVLAENEQEAQELLAVRNLGETLDGVFQSPNVLERFSTLCDAEYMRSLPKALHQACWVGWIAIKAGFITHDELLGDQGILHEMIHLLDGTVDISQVETSRALLARLESLEIGLFIPCSHSASR